MQKIKALFMVRYNYCSGARAISLNLYFCFKPHFPALTEWIERMNVKLGNGEGLKLFVKHSGELICFLYFFFLQLEEKKIMRCSSVLFTPACKFAFSMAHRTTNSLSLAEVGMHFWGLSSLVPCSKLVTRASCIGPSPDRNVTKDEFLISSLGSSSVSHHLLY